MVDLFLELLYEDDFIRIELSKRFSTIFLTFLMHPNPERFRIAYRLAIDSAFRKEVHYWLTDARQIKVMQPENQVWLKQQITPLLQTAKLQKFAIVMAPECFVMTNPNQVYTPPKPEKETSSAGLIKVHFDLDAAHDWLYNKD